MTTVAPLLAAALLVLPPVTLTPETGNFYGSYERDENGIIQAITPDYSECENDDQRRLWDAYALLANQQYTILHDNFGSEAAENANYGWVSSDGLTASKIRALNGYSTIKSYHDDDYVASRHVVTVLGDGEENGPETSYVPGTAGLAYLA